jgi:hypothetical protein
MAFDSILVRVLRRSAGSRRQAKESDELFDGEFVDVCAVSARRRAARQALFEAG